MGRRRSASAVGYMGAAGACHKRRRLHRFDPIAATRCTRAADHVEECTKRFAAMLDEAVADDKAAYAAR